MIGVWLENGAVAIRDVPEPEAREGEALIRVLKAGICNTDLELIRGYRRFTGILGHEFVGVVEEGPESCYGARVVGEINVTCGVCPQCEAGRSRHCESRTVLGIQGRDGAFAEFLTLPADNLHVVPAEVTTEAATFTEPLAAALEILEQVHVGGSDRVLVVGDGKLGQLVARVLALEGCELAVVGRHPWKLSLLEQSGIHTLPEAHVPKHTWDLVVECTGQPGGFETARRALRPRGTLVLKSTYAGELSLDASAVVVDELTIVGSRCGPFEPALRLLAEERVTVEPMVQARYPLSEAGSALERAGEPGVLKVLLEMEPPT
jgi:threonine dehydrogenase-like Zn-dependent dehydrogenase